jgi:acetoin utilization deacetylase AcuC-like enzyme
MSTAFYLPAECRLHDMGPGHPECPERLDAISDHLRATGLDVGLEFRDAGPAAAEALVRAHSANYVSELDNLLLRLLRRAPARSSCRAQGRHGLLLLQQRRRRRRARHGRARH